MHVKTVMTINEFHDWVKAGKNLVTIDKSQLKEFTVQKTSPMPSFKDKLTSQETADLIGYLLSLKGLN